MVCGEESALQCCKRTRCGGTSVFYDPSSYCVRSVHHGPRQEAKVGLDCLVGQPGSPYLAGRDGVCHGDKCHNLLIWIPPFALWKVELWHLQACAHLLKNRRVWTTGSHLAGGQQQEVECCKHLRNAWEQLWVITVVSIHDSQYDSFCCALNSYETKWWGKWLDPCPGFSRA